ncbi:hypothetical protein [Clostridium sp.]|uniref:hypothetical protein n=1 Tax=Clostridium sp. TaxID=1506 RepID=UPI003992101A
MVFKVFSKKKVLLFSLIILIIIFFSISLYFIKKIYLLNSKDESILTFSSSVTNDGKNFFIDLNGDNKKDIVYITSSSENQYIISCNINNKNYSLDVKSPLNTLGISNEIWPISINFIDLSRDKIPEIIIQSSENNIPINHIFKWNGEYFKDVYCSTNNFLGILDSNNNKTPKIISFSLDHTEDNIEKYMLINNNLKNISYEKIYLESYSIIQNFINIITLPYNLYDLPDIFSTNVQDKVIHDIDIINKDNFYYVFQDAFFKDSKWDTKGNITEMNWNLRFRKCSKSNKNENSLLQWNLTVKKINNKIIIDKIE